MRSPATHPDRLASVQKARPEVGEVLQKNHGAKAVGLAPELLLSLLSGDQVHVA